MYEPTRQFLSCHVAGFSHWYGAEVLSEMRPGDELALKAQPDNPYDPHAVEVYYQDAKIGYVPSGDNGVIAQLLFFGHDDVFSARVSAIRPDQHPEQQVLMTIFITDARKQATVGE
jgi:hypothetical protein